MAKPQTDYNIKASKMYGLRLNFNTDRDLIEKIERWKYTGLSYQELFKDALNDYFSMLSCSDYPVLRNLWEKMQAAPDPDIPIPDMKFRRS